MGGGSKIAQELHLHFFSFGATLPNGLKLVNQE
jgi:hypothetical protein